MFFVKAVSISDLFGFTRLCGDSVLLRCWKKELSLCGFSKVALRRDNSLASASKDRPGLPERWNPSKLLLNLAALAISSSISSLRPISERSR